MIGRSVRLLSAAVLLVSSSLVALPPSVDAACGVERWSVKTGADPDAASIDRTRVVSTTVEELNALPKPASLPDNSRISPTETTVYSVTATITVYKREDDSDYHVVLSSGGQTMIVELADPACVSSSSPLLDEIRAARAAFDARLGTSTSFRTANLQATITGVGFFDFLHGQTGVARNGIELHPVLSIRFASTAVTCTSSTGPGIPPPATVPAGIPGFHAAWYGQSGYPTLCPGERSTATVAYYNAGSLGWVAGRLGEVAYLGTWEPTPGQDRASALGGDGTFGSPATGWPRFNRVALQPAEYVGPGQVAWFQFTVQAPSTPGTYYLYIRPLIEGATWLEDYGVYWQVTVPSPTGTAPTPSPTAPAPTPTTAVSTPPASPTFDPSFYIGKGDAFNCADFASQADAQAVLRADPTDPNRLDADRDGIACESNRAPKDLVPVPRP